MNKTVKNLLIFGGLFWLFNRMGKGGVDAAIQSTFRAAGYDANNAKWWTGVSRFETANYTSELATRYNNFFGMTSPGQTRINTGKAGTTNFLSYATPQDSINDAVAWANENNMSKNYQTLASMIYAMSNNGYFTEDPNTYFLGVQADLNKI